MAACGLLLFMFLQALGCLAACACSTHKAITDATAIRPKIARACLSVFLSWVAILDSVRPSTHVGGRVMMDYHEVFFREI